MATLHKPIAILLSLFMLCAADSLYSRACSGGDPPEACLTFCQLCQAGCIPPGKTLATKTFYDVCNEEQQQQFDFEQKENTKICQEYMDKLERSTEALSSDTPEYRNKIEKGESFAQRIDMIRTHLDSNSLLLAIISVLVVVVFKHHSQIHENKKRSLDAALNQDKLRSRLEKMEEQAKKKAADDHILEGAIQSKLQELRRQVEEASRTASDALLKAEKAASSANDAQEKATKAITTAADSRGLALDAQEIAKSSRDAASKAQTLATKAMEAAAEAGKTASNAQIEVTEARVNRQKKGNKATEKKKEALTHETPNASELESDGKNSNRTQ